MSEPLPVGGFKFLSEKEIAKLDLHSISDDNEIGYIYDVDLEYPKELHDLHNDYPLAPESLPVSASMHSPYAKELLNKF